MSQVRRSSSSDSKSLPIPGDTPRELLRHWLMLSPEARSQEFAGTARAAEIAGVSQRTMQHWIDAGGVRSLRIGKKHQVHLPSLIDRLQTWADDWLGGEWVR